MEKEMTDVEKLTEEIKKLTAAVEGLKSTLAMKMPWPTTVYHYYGQSLPIYWGGPTHTVSTLGGGGGGGYGGSGGSGGFS